MTSKASETLGALIFLSKLVLSLSSSFVHVHKEIHKSFENRLKCNLEIEIQEYVHFLSNLTTRNYERALKMTYTIPEQSLQAGVKDHKSKESNAVKVLCKTPFRYTLIAFKYRENLHYKP